MKVTPEIIDPLLFYEEGNDLDFKSEQYRFIKSSDEEKSELLKDILAFTNAWKRSDAFILVGVKEVKGGKSSVVGIANKLDDAQIQQFVNSKTNIPIQFSYQNVEIQDNCVGVIHIPLQNRPVYLKKDYGRLSKETIYIRRGSSTDIAMMGNSQKIEFTELPELDVFFSNHKSREIFGNHIEKSSVVLIAPDEDDIPDYNEKVDRGYPLNLFRETPRASFYRDLVDYTVQHNLISPLSFAITNSGPSVAQDVRFEIKIKHESAKVTKKQRRLKKPKRTYGSSLENIYSDISQPEPGDVTIDIDKITNYWLIEYRISKIQPKQTLWLEPDLYIGIRETVNILLTTTCFSDNLPTPFEKQLTISNTATIIEVDLKDIKKIEIERFKNSEEFKNFQKKIIKKHRNKST